LVSEIMSVSLYTSINSCLVRIPHTSYSLIATKYFPSIFPTSWGVSVAFHQCPDFQTGHYCRPNYHVTITGSRILGYLLVFWENHAPVP
jgi:hypothetical protein